MSQVTVTQNQLFKALLGSRRNLDQALGEASNRIAEIGRRNTSNSFRSVKKDGASVTRLYDYELPTATGSRRT